MWQSILDHTRICSRAPKNNARDPGVARGQLRFGIGNGQRRNILSNICASTSGAGRGRPDPLCTGGFHMIEAMNHVGVDVAIWGNHEWDFGAGGPP